MDSITSLAATAVAVLAPYLTKAGEKFAEEAGKAALARIENLYQYLKTRFEKEPAAKDALSDLEANPKDDDVKATLRRQLTKQMNADPSIQDALQTLLKDIDQDKKSMSFLVQVYGGEVKNITQIGGNVDRLTIN
jgi:hypothetical protein